MIAIYPGSFDPITLGHIDIVERGCKLFEKVIVAVLRNTSKTSLFTIEQRLSQIRRSTEHLLNVEVACFDGLAVNYLSLIHISEPTRRYAISYAVFCLKKKT